MTVVDRIIQHGTSEPDKIAINLRVPSGDIVMSRADVIARSRMWARRYRELGLGKGSIVIVMVDHRPDLIFSYIGAMMAGCVPSYMPYSTVKQDPALYRRSHIELFARIRAHVLVTIGDWIADHGEAFRSASFTVINVDEHYAAAEPDPLSVCDDVVPAEADAIALLQHSSGTTDLKKGVSLSHRSILAQADAYAAAIALSSEDAIVSWLPLYHDMGLMACFILPLVNGVPVLMIDPFTWVRQPKSLLTAIEDFRGTLCWLPNFAFHHLARTCGRDESIDLSHMRAFIDCSEPCKLATFEEFAEAFGSAGVTPNQLQTCYAMAETTYAVTQSTPGTPTPWVTVDADRLSRTGEAVAVERGGGSIDFLSVGRAIDGTDIEIVAADGTVLADGMAGEIRVKSSSLFSGYFELPDATALAFQDGWYLTGDLGFLMSGELYITGRKKEMFIVRGRNFFAHEIESAVNSCAGVKPGRAVAIGIFNDMIGSEEVIIIAESEIDDAAAKRQLATVVKRTLDEHMGLQARSVEITGLGWLIKTSSGKISRKENLARYLAEKQ